MTLWELNICLNAYNRRFAADSKAKFAQAWQIAAMTGRAYVGKLKPLSHYLPDEDKVIQGAQVSDEDMRKMDAQFETMRGE